MAFLSSKRLWAFSSLLLHKSLMQEFCAYLRQGKSIFQSNTNSVYFSLRLVCVDKRKKLKKSPLQKSTKTDAHTLHTTQPKKFQKWKILSSKWRENTGFIQVCTKTKPTPPSLRRPCSLGLNKGTTERGFLRVGSRDVNPWGSCTPWNLQRLHQHHLHTPNTSSMPLLYLERDVHSPLCLPNVTAKAFSG